MSARASQKPTKQPSKPLNVVGNGSGSDVATAVAAPDNTTLLLLVLVLVLRSVSPTSSRPTTTAWLSVVVVVTSIKPKVVSINVSGVEMLSDVVVLRRKKSHQPRESFTKHRTRTHTQQISLASQAETQQADTACTTTTRTAPRRRVHATIHNKRDYSTRNAFAGTLLRVANAESAPRTHDNCANHSRQRRRTANPQQRRKQERRDCSQDPLPILHQTVYIYLLFAESTHRCEVAVATTHAAARPHAALRRR
jgi:hypothetical protein